MNLLAGNLRSFRKLTMPDIKIVENFQVERLSIKEKAVKIVTWTRPPMGQVKLNCDGSCCGNLSKSRE